MPSCAGLIRLIRRRFVLGIIFALSLTYCIVSLLQNRKKMPLSPINYIDDIDLMVINEDLMPDDNILSSDELAISDKSPWQMEMFAGANDNIENVNLANLNESDSNKSCRNSIQGKGLIVDERGLVCSRHEVLPTGCCRMEQTQTQQNEETAVTKRERYSCKTCNLQGCCTIYEYCVSCCLNPTKPILQMRGRRVSLALPKARKDEGETRSRRADRFQICLAVCRTSSFSMRSVHENTYKDPLAKHCYVSQSLNSRQRHNINSLNNNGDHRVVTSSSVVTFLTPLSPNYHFPV